MKTAAIIDDLRNRIVTGEFKPGGDLPRRHELLSYYDASVGAFQKCINHLTEEGFLESRGVKGTLVKPYPPHLYRIGIVIPSVRSTTTVLWDNFWQTFSDAVNELATQKKDYTFSFYYGIEAHEENADEWLRLEEDVRLHRLVGVIVLEHMRLSPLMQKVLQQLPMVVFSDRQFASANVLPLRFDYASLLEMAVKRLQTLGRKRVAVLLNSELYVESIPLVKGIMEDNGIRPRSEWIQGACLCTHAIPWTTQIVKMLFNPNQKEIPDSLVILNENLLEYVFVGLADLGLNFGRDVEIICHSNFPCRERRFNPVTRMGFDSRRMLKQALGMIDVCRCGLHNKPQEPFWAAAVWENDSTN